MVAEDHCLVTSERRADPLALGRVEHDAGVVVEDRMVLVEGARILRERIEQHAERRECLAVQRVRVGRSDDVRARMMNA